MENKNAIYDASYYNSHCGQKYERNQGWEEFFGKIATQIIKKLDVKTAIDVGCAFGFLVEALRDRGVDAEGIDISEYALSCVREDIKPYCRLHSITESVGKKYDLATCIEVAEHIPSENISESIANLCACSDTVLFSSTPFDYEEETHISVHNPEFWAEQFAYNGFYHDVRFDATFVTVQAMLFRRGDRTKADLIRDYEAELFQRTQENTALRMQKNTVVQNVEIYKEAYQKHVDMINEELNPKILELEKRMDAIVREKENEKEKALGIQKKYFESIISEKETVFQNRVREMDEKWNSQLKRQGADYEKQLESMESRIRALYDEEVEKRLYFEDRYAIYCDSVKAAEDVAETRKETGLIVGLLLKLSASNGDSIRSFIRRKIQQRKECKKLLKLDHSCWGRIFDASFYSQKYQDLAIAYGNDEEKLLKHFIRHGMSEGRRGSTTFDIGAYIMSNPDLTETLGVDLRKYYLHYMNCGYNEGRKAVL